MWSKIRLFLVVLVAIKNCYTPTHVSELHLALEQCRNLILKWFWKLFVVLVVQLQINVPTDFAFHTHILELPIIWNKWGIAVYNFD